MSQNSLSAVRSDLPSMVWELHEVTETWRLAGLVSRKEEHSFSTAMHRAVLNREGVFRLTCSTSIWYAVRERRTGNGTACSSWPAPCFALLAPRCNDLAPPLLLPACTGVDDLQ